MKKIQVLLLLLLVNSFLFAATYKLLRAQRANITTIDDLKIVGSYYPVKDVNPPAVIMLHMLGRNRGDWNKYARYLQKEGIAVLSVDLRGHGESIDKVNFNWRFFQSDEYQKILTDLEPVYKFLLMQKVNPKKIGIVGAGIGANVAINYAARNQEIASVVLISPGLEYKGITTADSVAKYDNRPLYMICGKFDEYSLATVKELQTKATGKVKLDVYNYPGSGSYLFSLNIGLQESITKWFKETLL